MVCLRKRTSIFFLKKKSLHRKEAEPIKILYIIKKITFNDSPFTS